MYDAIIVGARCAGSPLAMLLARKGYKVLVVDRSVFPSDTISTHHIHQPGVRKLKEWGVLDKLRASNCPPLTKMTFDVGPFRLVGTPPPAGDVAEAYAPRRRVIDTILVEAAIEAGAEFRDRFTVTELVWENGAVCGIRGRDKNGATLTERARIVIGADGARSFVAKAVEAPVVVDKGTLTCTYYTYYSDVPVDGTELYPRDEQMFIVDPTNNELTLVVSAWKANEFQRVRADIETAFSDALERQAPELAERVRGGRREDTFYGIGYVPNFIRRSTGAGWALIGDAGYHKDPATAQGITDAFVQAESLAEKLDAAFTGQLEISEALAAFETERNEKSMEMFEFTCQLAEMSAPPPEMQQLLFALQGNDAQISRFFGTVTGVVAPSEFYSPENMDRIMREAETAVTA